MNQNLIFLTEAELDMPIYRIFPFNRLLEVFQERKLTLVKPKLWDDPFENFILNSTGRFSDGREFQIAFRESFYGQCWSMAKENDGMWRIYSPEKNGVKVKTTLRKLFYPLFQLGGQYYLPNGELYNHFSFAGKVEYANTNKLISMLKDEERMNYKIFDQFGRGQASTFFFKRTAFKHEREIRIMFNSQQNNYQDIFKFDIEPNTLFDEVIFDPRMTETDYLDCRRKILNYGYLNPMFQSGLYKIHKFTISLTPTER